MNGQENRFIHQEDNVNIILTRMAAAAAALALGIGLYACGGGYNDGAAMAGGSPAAVVVAAPVLAGQFLATSLVVDTPATPGYSSEATRQTDPRLVNGWGVAFNPTGFVWVANNGSNTSTLYDGNGVLQSLVVALPDGAKPTGIVFNASADFKVAQAGLSGTASFIFAGEGGQIAGWSPGVDRTHTVTLADNHAGGAVYKGLAIGSVGTVNYLYAADFHNRRIDVFDASYKKATLAGSFTDPALPSGYAPFNVQALGGKLYVTYALVATSGDDEQTGAGFGIVDQFDMAGTFLRRVASGSMMNAPWGMALAPTGFGAASGMLLIGNFGDGKINVFDPVSAEFKGALNKADGTPVVIPGLWGIAFGNGVQNQALNTLYFAAGPGGEAHGAYGRIDAK
jgi:uncharacterized protein (TIGR03118 family)